MDLRDSEQTGTTANNTQQSILPTSPLDPSNDSISVPRSPDRPLVPLSPLELLPTEIHIEIIKRAAEPTDARPEYASLCKLAHTSPVFTKLAQAQLYQNLVLLDEATTREWLESAATIRGEFATRELQLGCTDEEEESISATSCEEVLAFQTSDLEELTLFGMKDVRSSSLISSPVSPASHLTPVEADDMWVGLRTLRLVESVLVDDGSEIVVDFRLRELVVHGSPLPPRYLFSVIESSSASITKLGLRFERGFDWSPLTSLPSPAFRQLEALTLFGFDVPPLACLSRCGTLKKLALVRITSNVPDPLSQLRKELASLPNPTLIEFHVDLRYIARDGGVVTLRELEELIEIPSLANLEQFMPRLPGSMDASDVGILEGIKGKKGKLVVEVALCESIAFAVVFSR